VFVSAIIAAGGRGARFGGTQPKQLSLLAGRPILQHSVEVFLHHARISEVIIALPDELVSSPPAYLQSTAKPLHVVGGGARRQDSVRNAFQRVAPGADIVVIHDAARPLVSPAVIDRTVDAAAQSGAAIAAVRAHDTVKRARPDGVVVETIPRDQIYLAQTPQAFRVAVLRDALRLTDEATDEAALAEKAGHPVRVVEGDSRNLKVTTPDDLVTAGLLIQPAAMPPLRIGNGYDLHRLVAGRPLILGGVKIPFDRGLYGHSDADAVAHAVTDAILGAAGAGDIGRHFPDTDSAWRDANSIELLRRAGEIVAAAGFGIVNIDVTVIAQQPKVSPHALAMQQNVADALGIAADRISVKGKTNEGVDSIGAGESIAVHAVALLAGVLVK
jgi:2-C-methyl-D-erythritol 4-phosphate cytidylyltransferase/2-C-methyl-D-erythritol 2,4-cyclodiphosphate synthase